MRYIEEVINIEVAAGQTKSVVEQTTDKDGSKIVGVVAYHNGLDTNTDIINARIYSGSFEISKNQHIDNYRSREAAYKDGFKPIEEITSGKNVRIEVSSETAFYSDFKAQFVLIKELNDC